MKLDYVFINVLRVNPLFENPSKLNSTLNKSFYKILCDRFIIFLDGLRTNAITFYTVQ